MNARLLLPTLLLLATPLAYSQEGPGPGPNMPPMHDHGMMHHEHHGDMGGPGEEHGMWWSNPEVIARLAITPDQKKKIDDIFIQSRVQLIDLHASLEKEQILLEPLMNANPVEQSKAMAQIDKIADTRAELEKTNAKMLLSIRSVLTPEQWTKLRAGHGHGDWQHHEGGSMGQHHGSMGASGFPHHNQPMPPTQPAPATK